MEVGVVKERQVVKTTESTAGRRGEHSGRDRSGGRREDFSSDRGGRSQAIIHVNTLRRRRRKGLQFVRNSIRAVHWWCAMKTRYAAKNNESEKQNYQKN